MLDDLAQEEKYCRSLFWYSRPHLPAASVLEPKYFSPDSQPSNIRPGLPADDFAAVEC